MTLTTLLRIHGSWYAGRILGLFGNNRPNRSINQIDNERALCYIWNVSWICATSPGVIKTEPRTSLVQPRLDTVSSLQSLLFIYHTGFILKKGSHRTNGQTRPHKTTGIEKKRRDSRAVKATKGVPFNSLVRELINYTTQGLGRHQSHELSPKRIQLIPQVPWAWHACWDFEKTYCRTLLLI